MPQEVVIGKITTSQGNKGEVRVSPLTDFPERFSGLTEVILDHSRGQNQQNEGVIKNEHIRTEGKYEIENVRFHKNFIILKLAGIDDIEAALALKNCLLKIPEQKLVPLEDGHYYIYQLRGASVETVTGEKLGKVIDVLKTGGTDIFLVQGAQKEYMLPASKEMIEDINIEKKRIIVEPIPGLLEL